jgi:hypothetical protein
VLCLSVLVCVCARASVWHLGVPGAPSLQVPVQLARRNLRCARMMATCSATPALRKFSSSYRLVCAGARDSESWFVELCFASPVPLVINIFTARDYDAVVLLPRLRGVCGRGFIGTQACGRSPDTEFAHAPYPTLPATIDQLFPLVKSLLQAETTAETNTNTPKTHSGNNSVCGTHTCGND